MLQDSLLQCEEQHLNLQVSLFTSYCAVQEVDINTYINQQHRLYIDVKIDFRVGKLMEVAANQFRLVVDIGTKASTDAFGNSFVVLTAKLLH